MAGSTPIWARPGQHRRKKGGTRNGFHTDVCHFQFHGTGRTSQPQDEMVPQGGAEGGTASTQELGENLPKCEELRTLPGMQSPR